jgi:hypothetical protein
VPCTASIIDMLEPFRGLFTAPTWKKMLTLLRGTLLARGRRTVTVALRQTGHEQNPNFSVFHQVLNCARWSPLQASRQLLALILETFGQAGGTLDIAIDETLERRWGAKIHKRGHYHDTVRSSHQRSVSSPGLRWIVLAVVVGVPWTPQRWALPFLCVLGSTPQVSAQLGLRHKTLGSRVRQVVSLLRRWLPGVPIKLLGDGAYSILELGLHCPRQQVTLIAPFRLDAMIHQPAPVRDAHTIGRPRVVGPRLPSLQQVLHAPDTEWDCLTLDWYGEAERTLQLCTGTAWWYRFGSTPLPIRWVLTRDLAGKRPPKALFSTDPTQPAQEIVRDAHETLEFGKHFRGKPSPFRNRDESGSGQTSPLSGRLRCSSGSTASSLSLDRLWLPMGVQPSGKRVGIRSQLPPSVIFWRWCATICGATFLFPHPAPTPMWFYCLDPPLHS